VEPTQLRYKNFLQVIHGYLDVTWQRTKFQNINMRKLSGIEIEVDLNMLRVPENWKRRYILKVVLRSRTTIIMWLTLESLIF